MLPPKINRNSIPIPAASPNNEPKKKSMNPARKMKTSERMIASNNEATTLIQNPLKGKACILFT